jgi:hypothetical protein
MSQLQSLYELILDKKIDPYIFQEMLREMNITIK